ncbi:MAG: ComF family protein [Chlamydiia bacterium]|nr:ComF family protein [Chlamydiia bacterium]
MMPLLDGLIQGVSDLVFPPSCLSCAAPRSADLQYFCQECQASLQLVDAEDRCERCFQPLLGEDDLCRRCLNSHSPLCTMALTVGYEPAAQALVRELKYGGKSYLAKGIAALMLAQWVRLDWPVPDWIVPVPISFGHFLRRGFNQTRLIAEYLSDALHIPLWEGLGRRDQGWAQAGLNRAERVRMRKDDFIVRLDAPPLDGKTVLIVDDVLTTGTTLRCCASALRESYCCSPSGLVFAGPI